MSPELLQKYDSLLARYRQILLDLKDVENTLKSDF